MNQEEFQKLVLEKLVSLEAGVSTLKQDVSEVKQDVSTLKQKQFVQEAEIQGLKRIK